MSSVKISGDTSGVITVAAPAVSGTNTITMPAATGTMALTSDAGGEVNKIINGNFDINQRAAAGTVVLSSGVYGIDRWKGGSGGGTFTFATSGGVTTLTISVGTVAQVVEGINIQTGTYILTWTGTATARIDSGSYGASGITGSLTGGSNATIEFSTGTVSQVKLELGSVATAFEYRQYGFELSLCQRYYQKYLNDSGAGGEGFWGTGLQDSTTSFVGGFVYQTPMRIKPTAFETSGTATDYKVQIKGNSSVTCSAVPTVTGMTTWGARLVFTTASGLTAGEAGIYRSNTTDAYIAWSAEL